MVSKNSATKLTSEARTELESKSDENWDQFYGIHANRFFKDRNWLFTELPELLHLEEEKSGSEKKAVFEVGCGVGNTVFPILQRILNPNLMVYCCDFSPKAVDLVREHPEFNSNRCNPFVCNVTSQQSWNDQCPIPDESLDIVLFIFALSAMEPDGMKTALKNVTRKLKPGGKIFFRDYGRYDLAQLRFKDGKCIEDNFYVRGDGTRCYFFDSNEVKEMFESVGLTEKSSKVDRRLQVNRGKQLKMYRVWIQAVFAKE